MDAKVLDLNTSETEWQELFTRMASAKDAPETSDPIIADVYSRMKVSHHENDFIKEIATGMVTEAEISTRIGTARREGRDEAKYEDAEALLRDGLPVDRVARVLNLPIETVQTLADRIKNAKSSADSSKA